MGEIFVNFHWTKLMTVLLCKFFYDETIEVNLDVLKIGHVPGGTKDSVVSHWMKTLDVLETGKGAIGG